MRSLRRRAAVLIGIALVVALAAWLASAILPTVGIRAYGAGERAALEVSADLPAATCRKEFRREFPWVRIWCESRDGAAATDDEAHDSDAGGDLDSTGRAE
jgi:hypothetical protein